MVGKTCRLIGNDWVRIVYERLLEILWQTK